MQEKLLKLAKKLINKFSHPLEPDILWFFPDEKNYVNPRSTSRTTSGLLSQASEKHGFQWCHATPLLPWGPQAEHGWLHLCSERGSETNVAAGRPYFWQQDSAPCHASKKIQAWLLESFVDHTSPNIWPPSSPNFFVGGAVEWDTNRYSCNMKDELKAKPGSPEPLGSYIRGQWWRLVAGSEAVIEAKIGFIDWDWQNNSWRQIDLSLVNISQKMKPLLFFPRSCEQILSAHCVGGSTYTALLDRMESKALHYMNSPLTDFLHPLSHLWNFRPTWISPSYDLNSFKWEVSRHSCCVCVHVCAFVFILHIFINIFLLLLQACLQSFLSCWWCRCSWASLSPPWVPWWLSPCSL